MDDIKTEFRKYITKSLHSLGLFRSLRRPLGGRDHEVADGGRAEVALLRGQAAARRRAGEARRRRLFRGERRAGGCRRLRGRGVEVGLGHIRVGCERTTSRIELNVIGCISEIKYRTTRHKIFTGMQGRPFRCETGLQHIRTGGKDGYRHRPTGSSLWNQV